jgi:hypothetical protein
MAKAKKEETLTVSPVRTLINREYMGMSDSDLNELDGEIDKLMERAHYEMEKAPLRKNDNYQRHAVVEELKGGESQ